MISHTQSGDASFVLRRTKDRAFQKRRFKLTVKRSQTRSLLRRFFFNDHHNRKQH